MRVLDWLEARTGIKTALGHSLNEEVAGGARLRYVFGSVLTYLFMQQVVLGILLAFYYSPSASDAWASTAYLNDQVSGGWFLRGLHHHGSSAMVVAVILHMLQVVWAGAYRAPREVNWWTVLAMGGLVLAFALTGYLLPWDQKGYWETQVATGIMSSVPGGRNCDEPVVNLDALTYAGNPENLASLQGDARHIFVHRDICDRELIDRLLAEHQPRAIVHFAPQNHLDRSTHGPPDSIPTPVNATFTPRGPNGEFSTTSDERAALLLVHDAAVEGPIILELGASAGPWFLEGCDLTGHRA